MKICQIVAYVSDDGAYGGPTTVAFTQCQALSGSHSVTLLAGTDGTVTSTTSTFDMRAGYRKVLQRAFRPFGSFGTLISPSLWLWTLRRARSFHVLHIHLARDFTVMPAAAICLLLRAPYVVQTHGMIKPPANWGERVFDALLTSHVLRGARRAFYLTESERLAICAVRGHPPLEQIRNAVPMPEGFEGGAEASTSKNIDGRDRAGAVRVLYCSRLHRRKRPVLFIDMAEQLAIDHDDHFTFRMIGPNGGELDAVRARLASLSTDVVISYEGAVAPEHVAAHLKQADILILPSVNEPFPMIVLEALAHGLPVVIDETCGLARILEGRCGVRIVDSSASSLAEAVRSIATDLVTESRGARQIATKDFSISILSRQLESAYQEVSN